MKFRVLGSLFLSSSLILAACGNESDSSDSDTKSEKKEEKKSSSQVVKDLQSNAKDVKSYHTDNEIKVSAKDQESQTVKVGMDVDEKETAKLAMDQAGQKMTIYVQGKKMIAKVDDQWVDLSSQVEDMNIDSSLEQLNYEKYAKTLNSFKDSKAKKVDDGYELTYDIKNKEDFTKLANASGNKDQLKQFESEVDKVSGKAVLKVNKDNEIDSYKLDAKLTKDDETANMETNVTYDKINEVKEIKIPDEAKDAKKIEDLQGGSSSSSSSSSSNQAS
ncbi:hypothetical protein MXL97_00255 [Mammaliicoccus fleurettii]|uniref:DUF6612 family protein n=1 Tax=Mammaliicoccus TaxID=2803850 RepID=UPI000D1C33B1|nr:MULTISPECIES: DUF6612 family protein [Mammaliicoccus]MBW0763916.1 hypothetical protein [Mammaliicoccus fleurettii]MEB6200238.1 hypothetical protein [Mammaliicoccus fleurettii]MEB7807141.1 hypothetical protein [Mammaliicoccus fleurettii]PTE33470.1 hypothetical protein BUY94_07215 [Mammaliicoccus fleurettii]